nr:hypothetical protein [Tanacetum cinerariifolium]
MPVLRLDLRCLREVAIYHGKVVLEDTSVKREKLESGLTRQLILAENSYDDLFDYPQQFKKLVTASRAKNLEKTHDPLALVAHTGSSSRTITPYHVTHPSSVVEYDDDYQGDTVQNNFDDPLTSAMILLAHAITQNFSNPTNNHLRTSSNTRNQAIVKEIEIQPANIDFDAGPSYDSAFLNEVQTPSTSYVNQLIAKDNLERKYSMQPHIINNTIGDDQIDRNIIFDEPNDDVNNSSVEHDNNAQQSYKLEQLAKNTLKKALYGLKQAPRAWGDILLVQVYVDDIIFGSTNLNFSKRFANLMKNNFEMLMMGELKFFLGLQVHQSPRGIFINQSQCAIELLKKHGMNDCVSMSTLMATEIPDADLQGTPIDQTTYRQMIRELMYLTTSRPDIAFATFVFARYQARPTVKHLKEVKWIFRYLRQSYNMGLWYPKDSGFELIAYSDADHEDAKTIVKVLQEAYNF